MKRLFLLSAWPALFLSFCFYCFAADTTGLHYQIKDNATGDRALLKLRDNNDGSKSIVVYAIILPSPTFTPTATATATFTPTPTPTP